METPVSVGAMYSGIHSQTAAKKGLERAIKVMGRASQKGHTEDTSENEPEKLLTLPGVDRIGISVQDIEELHSGQQVRENGEGRINKERSAETGHTVTHEL